MATLDYLDQCISLPYQSCVLIEINGGSIVPFIFSILCWFMLKKYNVAKTPKCLSILETNVLPSLKKKYALGYF